MMVTIGVYIRRGQRILRRWLADPRVHILMQGAGFLTAGFLSSAAGLSHRFQPITLGLICSQSGWPAVLIAAGGLLGYRVFWGSMATQGFLWVALGLTASLLWGLLRLQDEILLLLPTVAACITAATGLLFQYWRVESAPISIYLLRVGLAAFSTWVFSYALAHRDTVVDWLVYGLSVLCLAQVLPFPYFGLGYVAAGILAVTGAFPTAALAGLALDLAGVTPVPMTAVLCLAYMTRMIPKLNPWMRYLCPGVAFLLVMGLGDVWDLQPLPGLILGSFAAMLLPGQTEPAHRRGETGAAQVRLEMAGAVLSQTGHLLEDVEPAPIDEEALVARAVERACSGCPCRKNCKEKPTDISTAFLHRPLGNGRDLPSLCRKSGRLLQELRRSQDQLRLIRADRDRQQEYREAVMQQYRFLSEYLKDISDSLARRMDPAKPWFQPEIAACSASRERVNGDRCLWFSGTECRYYILLCDGMGTGPEAAEDGKLAGNMLRKLLTAGYPTEYALRCVNSLCALQGRAGAVTMDLAEIRLDTGKATLYKWGAAPSYLFAKGEPIKIGTATPPPGLSVGDRREAVERLSLRRGETLVLLSDGASGEDAMRQAWIAAGSPPGELAAKILESSQPDGEDDATVAVVRLHSPAASA